jgi:putative endonuclease
MSHFIYIIECADNSLYTGYTTDVARRVKEHNNEKGAKYTRGRTPVRLCYKEKYETRSQAQQREYEIKQLSRTKKLALIEGDLSE